MSEQASIVGAHPFLRTMPPRHTERLAAIAQHVRFPSGQRIFDEGEIARKFWLIDAGQVALDALVPGDGRVIIEMLGRGDLLGLSWLHPPYQWQYGATTSQPMQAFEFDALEVRVACDADPELGYELLRRVMAVATRRLHATRARLLETRAAPVPGR
jgi:CRP/FNR family transcriptional regulator, cyclic AMP receptor protein